MRLIKQSSGNLSIFLMGAIAILCVGFFIISCGNDPQQKTANTDMDACAVDFDACPSNSCFALPEGTDVNPVPSIASKGLTIEAWIKNKTTSTVGGIFGRYANFGAALFVNSGIPKFGIGRFGTSTIPEPTGCTFKAPTSTECVVSSDPTPATPTPLTADTWTHVAGVLVNAAHTHPSSTSCTTSVMAETPHIDIYIDGTFANCSTTGSKFADNPGDEKMSIGLVSASEGTLDGVNSNVTPDAVVDEIRFWNYARTPAQINACKGTELSINGGECDRGDQDLIAYYRLNECEGVDVTDFSGHGFNGSFETSDGDPFETGWVTRTDSLTPTRQE